MVERLKVLTVLLLSATIFSSYGALYYYGLYTSSESTNRYLQDQLRSVGMKVSIAISFGNGTVRWFNSTYVPIGSTVFNATYLVTGGRLNYTVYASPSLSGVFITGLMGVSQTADSFWLWYYFDPTSGSWREAPVGADQYQVKDGDLYLWNFTKFA